MSRARTIKPEWLDDERLTDASKDARLLSVALILLADDYGNGRAGRTYLARRAAMTVAEVDAGLAELEGWYVRLYQHDGQSYFSLRNWGKHQRIDYPGNALVPDPAGRLAVSSRSTKRSGTAGDYPGAAAPQPTEEEPPESSPGPSDDALSSQCRDSVALEGIGSDLNGMEGIGLDGEGACAPAREAGASQPSGDVRLVWDRYVEAWRSLGEGPEPKLTDKRRGLIRARLREHDAEVVSQAVRGVWVSAYHTKEGRTGIEDALRDTATVEELAGKWLKSRPRPRRPREPVAAPPPQQSAAERTAAAESVLSALGIQKPRGAA